MILTRANILRQAKSLRDFEIVHGVAGNQGQYQREEQHGLDADAAAALERRQLGMFGDVSTRHPSDSHERTDAKSALLLSSLLKHADRFHSGNRDRVAHRRRPIHRYGYGEAAQRTRKLADALRRSRRRSRASGWPRWRGTISAIRD
jgi:hypothetical protein